MKLNEAAKQVLLGEAKKITSIQLSIHADGDDAGNSPEDYEDQIAKAKKKFPSIKVGKSYWEDTDGNRSSTPYHEENSEAEWYWYVEIKAPSEDELKKAVLFICGSKSIANAVGSEDLFK
jgi:hypothetical protein